VVAEPLSLRPGNSTGSAASYYSDLYRFIQDRGRRVIAGHILNHQLFGSGTAATNIIPIPDKTNGQMKDRLEKAGKERVLKEGKVIKLEVTVDWQKPSATTANFLQGVEIPREVTGTIQEMEFNQAAAGEDVKKAKENPANWKVTGTPKPYLTSTITPETFVPSSSETTDLSAWTQVFLGRMDAELRSNPSLIWDDFAVRNNLRWSKIVTSPHKAKFDNEGNHKEWYDSLQDVFNEKRKAVQPPNAFKERDKKLTDYEEAISAVEREEKNVSSLEDASKELGTPWTKNLTRDVPIKAEQDVLKTRRDQLRARISILEGSAKKVQDANRDCYAKVIQEVVSLHGILDKNTGESIEARLSGLEAMAEGVTLTTGAFAGSQLDASQKADLKTKTKALRNRLEKSQGNYENWVSEIEEYRADAIKARAAGEAIAALQWTAFYELNASSLGKLEEGSSQWKSLEYMFTKPLPTPSPKLKARRGDSTSEREADFIADKVAGQQTQGTDSLVRTRISRLTAGRATRDERQSGGHDTSNLDLFETAHQSPAFPLPDVIAGRMERYIGADFTSVQIHSGDSASIANQRIGARAFTIGHDIYFNRGEYQPHTRAGQHLLAHELTHVVQQTRPGATPSIQRQADPAHDLTAPGSLAIRNLKRFLMKRALGPPRKGPEVRKVQEALLGLGFTLPKFGADGDYGSETRQAVREFQTKAGLSGAQVDGNVGPVTLGLLDRASRQGSATTDTDATEQDLKVTGKATSKLEDHLIKDGTPNEPVRVFFEFDSDKVASDEKDKLKGAPREIPNPDAHVEGTRQRGGLRELQRGAC